MELRIDAQDVKYFYHTGSKSFFQEQKYRFEETTYKGVPFNQCKDGRVALFTTTFVDALVIYNWFTKKGYQSAILADADGDFDWVVWIDKDPDDYMNRSNDTSWYAEESEW
jgi:hypothetical protein